MSTMVFRFEWDMAKKYMQNGKRACVRDAWFNGNKQLKIATSVRWDGEKYITLTGKTWIPTREDMAGEDWQISPYSVYSARKLG